MNFIVLDNNKTYSLNIVDEISSEERQGKFVVRFYTLRSDNTYLLGEKTFASEEIAVKFFLDINIDIFE